MDGPWYVDSKPPYCTANFATVTLSTTAKAVVPVAGLPVLPANYFSWVGKAVRIRYYGQITTGATPGNFTFEFLYGSGADAAGTLIQSNAYVMTANLTNSGVFFETTIRCRSIGTSGTLNATGFLIIQGFGSATFPASGGGAGGPMDLTAAGNVISPQLLRSGSTAESIFIEDITFEAMN